MYKSKFYFLNYQTIRNYFKFSELVTTSKAVSNFPTTPEQLSRLSFLWYVLNRIRDKFGSAIYINSAFRTPCVNDAVGGASKSYHLHGLAADIHTLPHLMDELWNTIQQFNQQYPKLFVEIIDHRYEKSPYIHIAVNFDVYE